jgi:hypothetical protein
MIKRNLIHLRTLHVIMRITIIQSFLFTILICVLPGCKGDKSKQADNTSASVGNSKEDVAGKDPFLIENPPGYYKPEGLRPLSLVEQFQKGKEAPFANAFPLKDKFGNPARWDTLVNSKIPIFLQVYVNEFNQPMEGVVYEMNDTIRGLIMRVRFAYGSD